MYYLFYRAGPDGGSNPDHRGAGFFPYDSGDAGSGGDSADDGNGTIEPTSALVTETLNGEYELQLVHPIDDAGKWQRLVEGCQIEQI